MVNENSLKNLNQFSSTNQPKNNGRKPSHLKKYLKENNIGTTDVRHILGGILLRYKTIDQLKDAIKDPKTPPMIIFPLKALLQDYAKGKLDAYKFLAEYGYGLPKQEIEQSGEIAAIVMTPEERRAEIDRLLKKRVEKPEDE